MAFIQYLRFEGVNLPLPDSYEVSLNDVEADSGGETEAGTIQRDVVRMGVVKISVSFSVTPTWLQRLTEYKQMDSIAVQYFDPETCEALRPRICISRVLRASWKRIQAIRGCGR